MVDVEQQEHWFSARLKIPEGLIAFRQQIKQTAEWKRPPAVLLRLYLDTRDSPCYKRRNSAGDSRAGQTTGVQGSPLRNAFGRCLCPSIWIARPDRMIPIQRKQKSRHDINHEGGRRAK